ncbi:LacI family DNA-binding transcriptional regulator [Lacisediminihabitans changchengi]|uniref:LacI family DNA-binding transcriptional regulator n=1 Tax=Lacisediminihabitans changchengi TaxID=2787634 RepID=A0A934W437_9MICO|nr:LacI family DNA-binding transcriptional regulator [Lacisediminihabitans changchengi]MBK4348541.1 LacI family DNA-binding transcriptional regulator [Lacisediminihabitans changchengi]
MTQLPTVLDVGRMAGVSRQTVSNVLNSPELVRPATRERVEEAIRQLGYRPHASARRLRTRKSSTIGVRLDPMANGISGAVLDRFLHALTEKADARGLRITLFTARDPDDEIRQFARLRDGADVDAFVLTSTFYGDTRTEWLIENDVPFVTFGRPWGIDDMDDPQHRWVDVDGWAGLREATRSLTASGAERIAFLGWPSPSGTGDDRRRGWRDALRETTALTEGEIAALDVASEDGVAQGRDAVRALLDSGVVLEGVVSASDSLALGALLALGPDIPVIGYDNTPVAAAIGLSSVEQPVDEVADGVLMLLLGERGNDVVGWDAEATDARHRLITPRLVTRTLALS